MIQCEPLEMDLQMNKISFLISLAWAEGGIDVGDPMLKIEKCCEGVRIPPTRQKFDILSFDILSIETQSVGGCDSHGGATKHRATRSEFLQRFISFLIPF